MTKHLNILFMLGMIGVLNCKPLKDKPISERPPNIILIMADDMGFECLSSNGSTGYSTPVLDELGARGIRFTKTISQPLCTPSRVKIMTGKYNFRNYEAFSYLNPDQRTFGHVMKEAGYATCVVGKWQLNGLKVNKPNPEDSQRPQQFGFDEYSLWQLTKTRDLGERFANPLIEQNGETLPRDEDAYGPDIVSNYALDFIDRNKDNPFFIYYPMLLVHNPFVPTPDSEEWTNKDLRTKAEPRYFKDMVEYTDKIVGNFVKKLEELGIRENTLLIFTGDNGTNVHLVSQTKSGPIRGAKGNTIDHGTHVPMVASWPGKIKSGTTYNDLIEFSDFYATFADIAGKTEVSDGQSFLPLLEGKAHKSREEVFVHYDPMWGKNVNKYRNQFARTVKYKLYQDGRFFDLDKDVMEEHPISDDDLTEEMIKIKERLKEKISEAPTWSSANP